MKKLLTIAVASFAIAAVADYTAPQIGVTTITATAKNTIIPVPFKALSDGTSNITVTDLVKTNSLPDHTWLLSYNGTAYNSWEYSSGVWTPASYVGETGISPTAGAANAPLTCGSALWIVLPTAESYNISVTVYGAYATGVTSAVAAGGENGVATLIANPLQGEANITVSPNSGDQIIIPDGENMYTYRTKKDGTGGTWRFNGASAVLPSFRIGQGFWYVRAARGAATEISWALKQ